MARLYNPSIIPYEYKSWRFSFCSLLQSPVTLSLLDPIVPPTPYYRTHSHYVLPLMWQTKFYTHSKLQGKITVLCTLMSVFFTWLVEITASVFFFNFVCVCVCVCVCVFSTPVRCRYVLRRSQCPQTCVRSPLTTVPTDSQYNFRYHAQILGVIFLVHLFRFPTGEIRLSIRTERSEVRLLQSDILTDELRGGHLDLTDRPSCCVA